MTLCSHDIYMLLDSDGFPSAVYREISKMAWHQRHKQQESDRQDRDILSDMGRGWNKKGTNWKKERLGDKEWISVEIKGRD